MIEYVTSDLFDSDCEVFVNTVNCVGVMGAGIALAVLMEKVAVGVLRAPNVVHRRIELSQNRGVKLTP
jgi:hypothetical protein